jgi:hypothetical protein
MLEVHVDVGGTPPLMQYALALRVLDNTVDGEKKRFVAKRSYESELFFHLLPHFIADAPEVCRAGALRRRCRLAVARGGSNTDCCHASVTARYKERRFLDGMPFGLVLLLLPLFIRWKGEDAMPRTLGTSCALCAALLFGSACVADAFARDFQRSGSYQTGKGRSGTYQSQGSRGSGEVTRDQSVTTQGGKTYNRQVNRSYDKETGTYNSSVTGPQGNTRTTTGTVGADGTRTGTVTTGSGKTATVSGNTVRNEDGVTRSGSVTTESGKTSTRSATTSYDKETGTVNRTVTGPGGNTRERSVPRQRDGSQ